MQNIIFWSYQTGKIYRVEHDIIGESSSSEIIHLYTGWSTAIFDMVRTRIKKRWHFIWPLKSGFKTYEWKAKKIFTGTQFVYYYQYNDHRKKQKLQNGLINEIWYSYCHQCSTFWNNNSLTTLAHFKLYIILQGNLIEYPLYTQFFAAQFSQYEYWK